MRSTAAKAEKYLYQQQLGFKKRNDFNKKKWRERRGSNPRPPA
jgi:hypothetical protein